AEVRVVFDLTHRRDILEICNQLGIPFEDSLLYVQRELVAEGRSQCRIGGKLMPVSALKQLGAYLVDLHGQHAHQSLLDWERHVSFLDLWIGAPAAQALSQVAVAFADMTDVKRRLEAVRSGLREREQKLDLLRFQIREIEEVDPRPGELAEL